MTKVGKKQQAIADRPDPQLVHGEVERLPPRQILYETQEFKVAHAQAEQIPNLLYEIGVLREQAFRDAGEGTGKSVDLDRFDLHYLHLFLWHKRTQEVMGAYRMGLVDRTLDRFGPSGLYTSTLFHFGRPFYKEIAHAIELGRSFVRPEWQRSYQPLLLLWKGIGLFVARNPGYSTLFGPVTISNLYHPLSRQLMVSFLKTHEFDKDLGRFVTPKTAPKKTANADLRKVHACTNDIEECSSLVADIETDRKGVPVLLRQYLKMGGRIVGFNEDRAFSNGLDGLILVDLSRCEPRVLERYMGKDGLVSFLSYRNKAETDEGDQPADPSLAA